MDKITRLKSSINPIISLTDEEYRIFSHVVKLKTLGKNEFLLEEGRICDFIGLVNHIKINRVGRKSFYPLINSFRDI